MLFKATFNIRLNKYLNNLKHYGYITYPDYKNEIKIFANGDISDGTNRFNLARAKDKKVLQIGYDLRLGYEGISDPHEVIVSETGTAAWNRKIKFSIRKDYDVMVAILKSLSEKEK